MFDLALIDTCKIQQAPTQIIKAIIKVESGGNPLAINVNKLGKKMVAKNKKEAIDIAKKYINLGYSVDMGLMQFNSNNLKIYPEYKIDDLFDTCKNIKLASDIFYKNYKATNKKDKSIVRIQKALSAYNTGNFTFGFKNGYIMKYKNLLKNWENPINFSINAKEKKYQNYLLALRATSKVKVQFGGIKFKDGRYVND